MNLNYDNGVLAVANGTIDLATAPFYGMLVTAGYVPNKATDNAQDDVTNEVVGLGYTAGGMPLTPTVITQVGDVTHVAFVPPSWPGSTITARAMVIYVNNGAIPANNPLLAYCDFGGNIISTGGTFAVAFSSDFRFDNT